MTPGKLVYTGPSDLLLNLILAVAIVLLAVGLFWNHYQMISALAPLDLYEGAMPLFTGIIAEGGNPYTRPFQPAMMDVYPPLYNIIVAPLSLIFGNTLFLHRMVAGLFVIAACCLCGFATFRQCRKITYSLAVSVLLYAALLFNSTPIASANATGVIIYLAVLIIPWLLKFNNTSLIFAVLMSVLSFYAKQYFVLCIAILCLYVFICISKRQAILMGLSFVTLMAISLFIVHKTSPFFLDNTFFSVAASTMAFQSWTGVEVQFSHFTAIYSGILLVLAIGICSFFFKSNISVAGEKFRSYFQFNIKTFSAPLLSAPVNYFWFCFVMATLTIIFSIGQNPGNYMTYLFQLMSPFFLIASFSYFASFKPAQRWLIPLVLVSFYQAYSFLPKDFTITEDNWKRIDDLIAREDTILATQMLLMNLYNHDKDIYQNGHTSYFPFAAAKPDWFKSSNAEDGVEDIWRNYKQGLYAMVSNKKFDVILISKWELQGIFSTPPYPNDDPNGRKFLAKYYYVADKMPLSMPDRPGGGPQTIQIWRPRKD